MSQASTVGPLHVTARVLANKRVGAYHHLTLVAPGVGERFRPGSFVALSIGAFRGESSRLARRSYWIHRVKPTGGHGLTVEIVVEPVGPASAWLAQLAAGTELELTGPLGRPFAMPKHPVSCLLVAEGVAAAAMFALAERLRDRECRVSMLLAADDESHLLSALEARRAARAVTVVTADGSVGRAGSVPQHLDEVVAQSRPDVVYAAGPDPVLHAVAAAAEHSGAWSQVALSSPLPCATGLCGGCAVPVVGASGAPQTARACVDGPVIRGDRIRWAELVET